MLEENKNIHPTLGYDINAPLPTMLDDRETFTVVDELAPAKPGEDLFLRETTEKLYAFLQDESGRGSELKRASIDEATFVRVWLPHFYSEQTPMDDSKGESVTDHWVRKVAGTVYNTVDVMREGKVIYRVPPVYGKVNTYSRGPGNGSVAIAYKEMEEFLRRLPSAKEAQINHLVQNIFDENDHVAVTRNLKYIFVLDEIFTYYGYDTILTDKIMSIKPIVMGVDNRVKPTTNVTRTNEIVDAYDDDSDLWD